MFMCLKPEWGLTWGNLNVPHSSIYYRELRTACQFVCRAVLGFCTLIVVWLIDWLFDFIEVNTNLRVKHGAQKRTDQ